jgi:hypothetical protein
VAHRWGRRRQLALGRLEDSQVAATGVLGPATHVSMAATSLFDPATLLFRPATRFFLPRISELPRVLKSPIARPQKNQTKTMRWTIEGYQSILWQDYRSVYQLIKNGSNPEATEGPHDAFAGAARAGARREVGCGRLTPSRSPSA